MCKMVYLNEEEIEILKKNINCTDGSHSTTWKRRQYAPMLIHSKLERLKHSILEEYPEYVITFDVVFESAGNRTEWHCDYESLGPFEVENAYESITNEHFCTIHFNLTENGGKLTTLDSKILSFIMYYTIFMFGIFTFPHTIIANFVKMISCIFNIIVIHDNTRGNGNFFNNMKLHSVTSGEVRTSYVVRLVKKECINISKKSIEESLTRSSNSEVFVKFMYYLESEDPIEVSKFPWETVK